MTLAEIRAYVQRVFGDLEDDQANMIINAAVTEVDSSYPWPYREASVTGTSPLAISDLGEIEAVTNEDQNTRLEQATYGDLLDNYGDLTTSGTASLFYVSAPGGVPTVATYPSNDDTIGVQYYSVGVTLSADADEPNAPARYHWAYVATACRMAAADAESGSGAYWSNEADRAVQAMVMGLLPDQMGQGQRIVHGADDW